MRLLIPFLAALISTALHAQVNTDKDRQFLLQQHEESKRAHYEHDAAGLVRANLDSFIYVGRGDVSFNMRADSEKMFTEYLANAEYLQYEDLIPPIVRISDDGTMAWMITKTAVKRRKKSNGETKEEGFVYAGIMTYKKVNGMWMREANVSTFADVKRQM